MKGQWSWVKNRSHSLSLPFSLSISALRALIAVGRWRGQTHKKQHLAQVTEPLRLLPHPILKPFPRLHLYSAAFFFSPI